MKCNEARAALPLLIYGDADAVQQAALRDHLARCADCRREQQALKRVQRLLHTAVAPPVALDISRLQQAEFTRQLRRVRRWRRSAVALGAVAALLLLGLGLRLEVRLSAGQLTLRWGEPPTPPAVSSQPLTTATTRTPETEAELRILSELLHALKQDAEERDRQSQERLDLLQERLHALQTQTDQRWDSTEQDVTALYLLARKGEKP
jgi:anti-sigma factor RsiW